MPKIAPRVWSIVPKWPSRRSWFVLWLHWGLQGITNTSWVTPAAAETLLLLLQTEANNRGEEGGEGGQISCQPQRNPERTISVASSLRPWKRRMKTEREREQTETERNKWPLRLSRWGEWLMVKNVSGVIIKSGCLEPHVATSARLSNHFVSTCF